MPILGVIRYTPADMIDEDEILAPESGTDEDYAILFDSLGLRMIPNGCIGCGEESPDNEICDRCYSDLGDHYEGKFCSLCDALGHGYPGGGPCPLEDRSAYDPPDPFDYEPPASFDNELEWLLR